MPCTTSRCTTRPGNRGLHWDTLLSLQLATSAVASVSLIGVNLLRLPLYSAGIPKGTTFVGIRWGSGPSPEKIERRPTRAIRYSHRGAPERKRCVPSPAAHMCLSTGLLRGDVGGESQGRADPHMHQAKPLDLSALSPPGRHSSWNVRVLPAIVDWFSVSCVVCTGASPCHAEDHGTASPPCRPGWRVRSALCVSATE